MTRSRFTGDVGYRAYKKNYIINGNFDIWQRGESFTAGIEYTADRWYSSTSNSVVDKVNGPTGFTNALSISNTVTHGLNQYIELPEAGAAGSFAFGSKFTVGMWVSGTAGQDVTLELRFAQGTVASGTKWTPDTPATHTLTGGWEFISTTVTVDQSPTGSENAVRVQLTFFDTVGPTRITGVQVESGTVATPFEYRPKGEELALCQRYYTRSLSRIISSQHGLAGAYHLYANVFFPVEMRVNPTVTTTMVNIPAGFTSISQSDIKRDGFYGDIAGTYTGNTLGSFNYTADSEF